MVDSDKILREAEEALDPKTRIGSKKLSFSGIPIAAFVSTVGAFKIGAEKYGEKNWIDKDKNHKASVYLNGALRHLILYMAGEDKARDSGVCHLEHAVSGLCLLKESQMLGTFRDDRVKYPKEYLSELNRILDNESAKSK